MFDIYIYNPSVRPSVPPSIPSVLDLTWEAFAEGGRGKGKGKGKEKKRKDKTAMYADYLLSIYLSVCLSVDRKPAGLERQMHAGKSLSVNLQPGSVGGCDWRQVRCNHPAVTMSDCGHFLYKGGNWLWDMRRRRGIDGVGQMEKGPGERW